MIVGSEEWRRLRWYCRRGLLELDIILLRYLERDYAALDKSHRQAFSELLELSDHTLLAYLNKQELPDDPRLRNVIKGLR